MGTKVQIYKAAVKMAEEIHAAAIIVTGDMQERLETKIPILVAMQEWQGDLTRTYKLRDAVLSAYVDGKLKMNDIVVGILGNIVIAYDLREEPVILSLNKSADRVAPKVTQAILDIALELGYEGREGKCVGTAFTIGDTDEVLKRSHQLILNPYEGHGAEERDVTNRDNWETIKDFAQLDGMFIVDESGKILAAGRYLDVNANGIKIQKGLGGRHIAAAAITRDTNAIAITVSQSGGTVRTYKDGLQIAEIEPH
ncbi:MAG: diadenylate cyclase [Methanocellales archaeon]|nr:diadenylate cyclase [Methanocellales archaeon]MDD3292432.1 diadenylate cyclase [Methanocellales archaeon]MDD5236021.1 diadenylate cyclase [Methanocellales archaeon]MDD5485906.1 diadenylate cyclase [Methanocellales archaeon]